MLAQRAPGFLVQRFHIFAHIRTIQQAQALDHLKRKATRHAGQGFVALHVQQRFKQCRDFAVYEMLQATGDFFCNLRASFNVNEGLNVGFERIGTGDQFTHSRSAPHQTTLFSEIKFSVRRIIHAVSPQMKLRC